MGRISPFNLLFYSIFVWFIAFFLIPYNYHFIDSPNEAIFFIFFYIISFAIGLKLSINKPQFDNDLSEKNIFNNRINVLFYCALLIGIIGVFLRLYQRIYIDQVFLFDSFTEYRFFSLETETEISFINILASIMYPFGLTALVCYIYFKEQIKISKYVVIFAAIMYPLESILLGGRLTIIFFGSIIFFAFQIRSYLHSGRLLRIRRLYILYFFIIISIFSIYSSSIVSERLSSMGFTLPVYLNFLEISRVIDIDDSFYNFIDSNNFSGLGNYLFIITEIFHYYLSGIIEFIKLYNFNDTYEYWLGAHQFNIYLKFLSFFGIENLPTYQDTLSSHHQPGQYTSFLGPTLIDFGKFSLIYIFLLGIIIGKIFNSVVSKNLSGIMFYPLFATTVIFSPMIHLLMASSLYIINAFIIFVIATKIRL